jgi:hypothetical protein
MLLSLSSYTADSATKVSIQDAATAIDAIQTYEVNLHTKIYPPTAADLDPNKSDEFDQNYFMEVNSKVYGQAGKIMKIVTITKQPKLDFEIEHTLIFDGTWLWVQQKVNKNLQMTSKQPMVSAMKIHIPSVSPDPKNEPFNTFYGISGMGLIRYKDLPGTFKYLVDNYSLANGIKPTFSNEIIFSGIKKSSETKGEKEKGANEFFEFMDKNTIFCKLWISDNNGRITAYSIGKSEKRPSIHTKIEYISVNKQMSDDIFSYAPPAGITVRDVTADILKQKEKNH